MYSSVVLVNKIDVALSTIFDRQCDVYFEEQFFV